VRRTSWIRIAAGAWIAYTQNQPKQPPQLKVNKVTDDL
jgi:hypothetical protein